MSFRNFALAVLSAAIFAACSDDANLSGPLPEAPMPAFAIDAAVACTGATMPGIECEALVALYNQTNGPGWLYSDDWGVVLNPCSWNGVTCTAGDHGSVEELSLWGRNLSGPLPGELGNLTALEVLRLYDNALVGPIPSVLGNLAALEILNLPGNQLTGAIPAELENLSNLTHLLLNDNNLTGPVPSWLGDLPNLEALNLGSNQFTGSIPPEIGAIETLVTLDLGNNQLTGAIPAELGNLSNLYAVVLNNNQLTGSIPPELSYLSGIWILDLDYNQLTGSIPAELGNLNTTHVRFLGNELSGLIPLTFAELAGSIICVARLEGVPGNEGLYIPDTPEYRAADIYDEGGICNVPFSTAEDIGEDAADDIDELVPDVLNEGQANALKAKIENAIAKAANGQYAAAINQLEAFISQLQTMVEGGTLTAEQAAPFLDQAESLIAIWTALL
jgi:hypothetical protein